MTSPLDFLGFLNAPATVSTTELLGRVLSHSRRLTGAEAGTIFMLRRQGRRRWLEATHFQNDSVRAPAAGLRVPLSRSSIAGYVAATGRVLRIDDANDEMLSSTFSTF